MFFDQTWQENHSLLYSANIFWVPPVCPTLSYGRGWSCGGDPWGMWPGACIPKGGQTLSARRRECRKVGGRVPVSMVMGWQWGDDMVLSLWKIDISTDRYELQLLGICRCNTDCLDCTWATWKYVKCGNWSFCWNINYLPLWRKEGVFAPG